MLLPSPEHWMLEALKEAEKAEAQQEVPVGAVIVQNERIIGRGHNLTESLQDATQHAEIIAIQQASKTLNNWRLENTAIFVTMEPCPMCIGAILLARVSELYFGCYDPKLGAVGSLFNIGQHPSLPRMVKVYPEVLAAECSAMLQNFFSARRSQN